MISSSYLVIFFLGGGGGGGGGSIIDLDLALTSLIYVTSYFDKLILVPKLYRAGARFTKHLKLKIFVSSIQFVWNLRKS